MEGYASAYLFFDDFQAHISDTLHKIIFGNRVHEMNAIGYANCGMRVLTRTAGRK